MASLKATVGEVGARLGLKPVLDGSCVIGLRDGYPVQLHVGDSNDSKRIFEVLRFDAPGRELEVREALREIDEAGVIQTSRLQLGNGVVVYQHKRQLFRSASPDRVLAEFDVLLRAVKRAVPPPPASCRRCGSASGGEPILLDGVVDRACPSCIERLHHDAKVAADRYDDLPMNLPLAVLAAAILAVVSGAAWAGLVTTTHRMAWVVAIGIGTLIGWGTTRAAGKGGRPVQVVSALFTVLAVLLGQVFAIAWAVNQEAQSEHSQVDWNAFVTHLPAILRATGSDTGFALLGGLLGSFYAIKRAGKPKLDVNVERPGSSPAPNG